MAGKLKSTEDWNKLDKFRMESAFAEISASDNLRYLFAQIFSLAGVSGTPIGVDPHSMAICVGRHMVGTEVLDLMMFHQPTLYGGILIQDADETVARAAVQEKEDPDDEYDT